MADSWLNAISTGLDNGEVFKRWNYVNRWKYCIWEVVGRARVSLNSVQARQVYSLLNFDFFYLENRLDHVVPSSLPTVPWSFFLCFFFFFFFNGSIVDLQYFRCPAKWFSYIYTNIYTHTYICFFPDTTLYKISKDLLYSIGNYIQDFVT